MPMLRREHDPALDVFDKGCLVLRRDGEVTGHVGTTLGTFWSTSRPLTWQQWVWFKVVWADGVVEDSFEDYPPWTVVTEVLNGTFTWDEKGPHRGEHTAEWLPDGESRWPELGITLSDI